MSKNIIRPGVPQLQVETKRYQRRRLSVGQSDFPLITTNQDNDSRPELGGISPSPTRRPLRNNVKKSILLKSNQTAQGSHTIIIDKNEDSSNDKENTPLKKNASIDPKEPMEMQEILEIAKSVEEESSCSFIQIQKWIPLWADTCLQEKNILYFPELYSKDVFFDNQSPKNLEDEGFYVNDNIDVPFWNFNKMEKRLVAHDGKSGRVWFGDDFRMKTDYIPISRNPT